MMEAARRQPAKIDRIAEQRSEIGDARRGRQGSNERRSAKRISYCTGLRGGNQRRARQASARCVRRCQQGGAPRQCTAEEASASAMSSDVDADDVSSCVARLRSALNEACGAGDSESAMVGVTLAHAAKVDGEGGALCTSIIIGEAPSNAAAVRASDEISDGEGGDADRSDALTASAV